MGARFKRIAWDDDGLGPSRSEWRRWRPTQKALFTAMYERLGEWLGDDAIAVNMAVEAARCLDDIIVFDPQESHGR